MHEGHSNVFLAGPVADGSDCEAACTTIRAPHLPQSRSSTANVGLLAGVAGMMNARSVQFRACSPTAMVAADSQRPPDILSMATVPVLLLMASNSPILMRVAASSSAASSEG